MNILTRQVQLIEKLETSLVRAGLSKEAADREIAMLESELREESPMTVEELQNLIKSCRACYGKDLITEHGPVPGRGQEGDIDILFVGLMPGSKEEETGQVFTGPNSSILVEAMAAAGIGKPDCKTYAHNLVCCMPLGKNPRVPQINNCVCFLAELVWLLDPNIVVPLGSTALSIFLGKPAKINEYDGQVQIAGDTIIVPLKHPSALHRITNPQAQRIAFSEYKEQVVGIKRLNDRIKLLRQQGKVRQKRERHGGKEEYGTQESLL